MKPNKPESITLAMTGASGMPYGVRLLECLLGAGIQVNLLFSQAAQIVASQEMDLALPARAKDAQKFFCTRWNVLPGQLLVYGREEWFAPVASGSNAADAKVVCPCSSARPAPLRAGGPETR